MTATNHALTGAIIGLIIGEPLVAVPAAVASHFICDALPHFASATPEKTIKSRLFRNYLLVEAGLCLLLVVILLLAHPAHWLLAAVCAFLAAVPDFLWINKFRTLRGGRKWHPSTFSKFASGIQWFQRPIGAIVEIVWFISALVILLPFLR